MKKITLLLSAMLLACATNLWAAEPVTVTKTVDDLVTELEWTVSADQNVTCYKSFNLDENITVSTSGENNCGSVWGTKNRDWRLYQAQKGDVTITAAEGYSINSITLTYGKANDGILLNGTATCTSGTAITVNDKSITLTVGKSKTGKTQNGQIKINQFSVTYVAASSAATLQSLAITGEPKKKEYIVDERFDVTGLTVTATYSDGNTADVTGTVDWLIDPETFTTIGENLSVNVSASIGSVTSDVVTISNIKVRNLYNYAITWKVNGEAYTTGDPTTTVVEGNKITVLPATPADNTLSCTNAFVGWSTTDLGSEAGLAKPADLFTKVEKAPVPTGDMTFYAVFATTTVSENTKLVDFTSGGKSALAEIAGVATYGLGDDYTESHAPYIVKFDGTNDSIIWENINLCKVDSVTFGVKMVGGKSTSTMTVLSSADGTTYTKVQACEISGSQNDILSFKVPIAATPAFIKLNFTKGSNVGFGNFVIYGTGITYADYRTACGTTPSVIDNAAVETPVIKTIENGQLVILRDGVKYNAMGVRLQ